MAIALRCIILILTCFIFFDEPTLASPLWFFALIAILYQSGVSLNWYVAPLFKENWLFVYTCLPIILGLSTTCIILLTWGNFGGAIDSKTIGIALLFQQITSWFLLKRPLPDLPRVSPSHLVLFLPALTILGCYIFFSFRQQALAWDHFTFWLVNAKEIFLNGALPSNSEKLFSLVNYPSFIPLHAVLLYNFYNLCAENFNFLFNALYLFSGLILVGGYFLHCPRYISYLTGIYLTCFAFSTQFLAMTFYADLAVCFYITIVATLIFIAQGNLRTSAIIFFLIVILAIKPTNIIYVLELVVVFLLYEVYRTHCSLQELSKSLTTKVNLGFLLFACLYIGSTLYYKKYINLYLPQELNFYSPSVELTISYLSNRLLQILVYLYSSFEYLIYGLCLFVLFVLRSQYFTGRNLAIFLAFLLVSGAGVAYYFIHPTSFHSNSLKRYITAGLLIFPLLLITENRTNDRGYLSTAFVLLLCASGVYLTISTCIQLRGLGSKKLIAAEIILPSYQSIATKIKIKVGDSQARIAIYSPVDDQRFVSGRHSHNIIKYFLLPYKVDKFIGTFPYKDVNKLFENTKPTHVLLWKPDDAMKNTFKNRTTEELIQLDKDIFFAEIKRD
ncbi:MAG: hypothetical protein OEL83_02835 [Desulforhopalus sp.]|nr:hypothetical protein [Desulforhopalus sp.]